MDVLHQKLPSCRLWIFQTWKIERAGGIILPLICLFAGGGRDKGTFSAGAFRHLFAPRRLFGKGAALFLVGFWVEQHR